MFCSPIVFSVPMAKSLEEEEEEFISSGFSCYELDVQFELVACAPSVVKRDRSLQG